MPHNAVKDYAGMTLSSVDCILSMQLTIMSSAQARTLLIREDCVYKMVALLFKYK